MQASRQEQLWQEDLWQFFLAGQIVAAYVHIAWVGMEA